jgi:hypothetical protein
MLVFQQNITIATGFYPASLAIHTIRISMVTFRWILAIQCFRHTTHLLYTPYKIFMLVSQQMLQVLRFRHFTLTTHSINIYMFTKYLLTEDRFTPIFIPDAFPTNIFLLLGMRSMFVYSHLWMAFLNHLCYVFSISSNVLAFQGIVSMTLLL